MERRVPLSTLGLERNLDGSFQVSIAGSKVGDVQGDTCLAFQWLIVARSVLGCTQVMPHEVEYLRTVDHYLEEHHAPRIAEVDTVLRRD